MNSHVLAPGDVGDRRLRVLVGADAGAADLAALLDRSTVRLVLPDGEVPWRLQVLSLTLADLLGRLFPRLAFVCDDATDAHRDLPPGPQSLSERLAAAARRGGLPAADPGTPLVTVRVGAGSDSPDSASGLILEVDGGGWISYNGTIVSKLPDGEWGGGVPIGPMVAACRAAAQVTDLVLSGSETSETVPASVYAEALTYSTSDKPLEGTDDPSSGAPVFDGVLVGAGSIGGAAVYALAHTPGLSGSLVVTDPQRLEAKNLDRALLATVQVTQTAELKTDVARDALAHLPHLAVTAWPGTLQEWIASRAPTDRLPLVLAAVDSRDARRGIQDCLPLDLINAACNPTEVHLSGHRTGEGPCVCCLHMEEALDSSSVRSRLIAADTNLPERMVDEYLAGDHPMQPQMLRHIERFRGLPSGAMSAYEGRTLEELRQGALLYGATPIATGVGTVAVAAPYITALAGVLLAGEALKASTAELGEHRLGPHGPATKYAENPIAGADRAMLTNPPRWSGSECLCRSTRRLRLTRERYGVDVEAATAQDGDDTPQLA